MLSGVSIIKTSYISQLLTKKKRNKKAYVMTEESSDAPMRRDLLAVAVREANDLILSDDVHVENAVTGCEDIFNNAMDFQLRDEELPVAGWARRNGGRDDLFGARYIGEFEDELWQLYQRGNKETTDKMSPGSMLETIVSRHPNRIAMPTEYEVRCRVGSWVSSKKKDSPSTLDADAVDDDRIVDDDNIGMPKEVVTFIRDRFYGDIDAKPAEVLDDIVATFPTPQEDPEQLILDPHPDTDDAAFKFYKKKISSVKRQLKDNAWRNIL
jgi:hypothetical protein